MRLLRAHEVRCLAAVRRYPGSRWHPHVNAAVLAAARPEQGVAYVL